MRTGYFLLITTAILILCNACGDKAQSVNAPAAASTPAAANTLVLPKDGNYDAKGTITKIDTNLPSIEFDHEDIPGIMPAMRMEFFVKDKAILDGLAVGDAVNFVLEYRHPAETVVSVTKIQ